MNWVGALLARAPRLLKWVVKTKLVAMQIQNWYTKQWWWEAITIIRNVADCNNLTAMLQALDLPLQARDLWLMVTLLSIGRVKNIPTMLFFTEILSQNLIYVCNHWLSVWEFQNNAFWDTHYCAIIIIIIMEEYALLLVTKPARDGEGL